MLIREKVMHCSNNSHHTMSHYIDSLEHPTMCAKALTGLPQDSHDGRKKGLDDRRLEKVLNYINTNMGASITLVDLAKEVNLSDFHFSRLFKARPGQTPLQYVNEQCLLSAKHFLVASSRSITWITYELGYQDTSYFSNKFKRCFGVSPSEYRKLNRVIV